MNDFQSFPKKTLLITPLPPTCPLKAQGCHASVSAIVKGLKENDSRTGEYTEKLEDMRKVVLKIANDNDLTSLRKTLDENGVQYHCWVEQPENIQSCLATFPSNQDEISKYFKHLKLYK